jgi:hypothetical protein
VTWTPVLPLTGGTLTGGLTAPTLTTTGTTTVTGNLTVGGTPSLPSITQNGTGNFLFSLGAAASVLNFRTNTGTSMLQIGGASQVISAQTAVQLRPNATWVGASNATNAALYLNNTWTGSPGGNIVASPIFLQTNEGVQVGSGGGFVFANIHATAGTAGFTGNRQATLITQDVTAASGNTAGGVYDALNIKVNGMVNDGGTALSQGNAKGSVFAFNPVAHLGPSATFWAALVGEEIDTWAEAQPLDKIGTQIVDVAGSNFQGFRDDTALSFNNQYPPVGGSTGWRALISVGRHGGYNPLDPTQGWVLRCFSNDSSPGTPIAAAGGLDFTNFVPAVAFMRGNGFLLDPAGNFTAASFIGASATISGSVTSSGSRRTLYVTAVSVGNGADITEDTLQSFTIPAGLMANVGDIIHVVARGAPLNSADVKVVRLKLGGTNISALTLTPSSTQPWLLEAWITKTAANTQSTQVLQTVATNNTTVARFPSGITDTASMALLLTGQNSTNPVAGSITCDFFDVEYCRAP